METLKKILKKEGFELDEEVAQLLIYCVFKRVIPENVLKYWYTGQKSGWDAYEKELKQNLAALGVKLED